MWGHSVVLNNCRKQILRMQIMDIYSTKQLWGKHWTKLYANKVTHNCGGIQLYWIIVGNKKIPNTPLIMIVETNNGEEQRCIHIIRVTIHSCNTVLAEHMSALQRSRVVVHKTGSMGTPRKHRGIFFLFFYNRWSCKRI